MPASLVLPRANVAPRHRSTLGVISVTAITLPRLVGTRQAADSLVEQAGLEPTSHEVTVFARAVSSAAPSFADELVRSLSDRGVRKVRVVGSSDTLLKYLQASALRRGSIEIIRTSSADLVS
jgi:hypothetical protein